MKTNTILDGQDRVNQAALHRWFWRSVLLLSVLFAGILIISVQQQFEYHAIQHEYVRLKSGTAELHACLEKKRQLKDRSESLQTRLGKINNIKYRPKNPAALLKMLTAISVDITLDDITVKKKVVDLVLFAQGSKAIFDYAEQLRAQEMCARVDVRAVEQAVDRVKALLHIVLR